jgi:hypothetical protein
VDNYVIPSLFELKAKRYLLASPGYLKLSLFL